MKQKKRWCLPALVGTRAVALVGTRTQDAYYSHLISASAVCEIQIDHRLRGKGRGAELVSTLGSGARSQHTRGIMMQSLNQRPQNS
ncbi:hypothetical protein B0T12DRAFT_261174 [Alternaria alternata]|nr:hypothetical protein B0T12DRAFT_261174 [Alternaria alternata]